MHRTEGKRKYWLERQLEKKFLHAWLNLFIYNHILFLNEHTEVGSPTRTLRVVHVIHQI